MNRYRIIEENLIGNYHDSSINYDLLNIITIGLGKVEDTQPMTILNMLDTLLYSDKPSEEKRNILKNVYNIPISDSIIEEVNTMCNLGEGIYERAYNKAVAEIQANQATVIQQLIEEKTKALLEEKTKALLEEKTKALLEAGVPQDVVDKIMKAE